MGFRVGSGGGWECRSHLGEYTAKPPADLGQRRLFFLMPPLQGNRRDGGDGFL